MGRGHRPRPRAAAKGRGHGPRPWAAANENQTWVQNRTGKTEPAFTKPIETEPNRPFPDMILLLKYRLLPTSSYLVSSLLTISTDCFHSQY